MSFASWSGCLTLRPRLRSIWVADPALPMCVAWEIAVASNGVGGLMLLARAYVDPADGWGLHAAATTITRADCAPSARRRQSASATSHVASPLRRCSGTVPTELTIPTGCGRESSMYDST